MEKLRRHIGLLLLAVFLSAFVTSVLHRHPAVVVETVVCDACAQHLPHSGHIGDDNTALSQCVLCHFLGLPFLVVLTLAILPSARLIRTLFTALRSPFVAEHLRLAPSRAPPVVSFV